jgi:hypothetical protein
VEGPLGIASQKAIEFFQAMVRIRILHASDDGKSVGWDKHLPSQ